MTGTIHEVDIQRQDVSLAAALQCAWPALLLATLCLLPFLNKAYHTDDPWFLAVARQIVKQPLHPSNFEICWNTSTNCVMVFQGLTPGVLMGYALVPTVLAGAPEWMAHLTQVFFVWIAVIAMSSLALQLSFSRADAMAAALFLVAIPPLLPMASTAMPDVLAAALALVAFDRLAAWKSCGKWSQGIAAGVALGLAGIARTHLALLVPLGALFLFDSINPQEMLVQLRQRLWLWIPILIGGCVLLGILYATRERSLMAPPASFVGREYLPRNLRTYPLYFCFPLPLAAYWAAARWTGPRRLAIVLVAAIAGALLVRDARIILPLIGLSVLADLLLDAYRKRDQLGTFLALWLFVPLPIVYYGHFPIKYLLPCTPAVIFICFRLAKLVPVRLANAARIFLIVVGAAYTVLILRSDAEFAEFGRVAMNRLIRPHTAAGEKVWIPGHYSAYWYAPAAGAQIMTNDRGPERGDLLAVGLFEAGANTLRNFPKRTLVQSLRHTYSFGRTMGAGVGLYTNASGSTWLWGFGISDQDRYELWRID